MPILSAALALTLAGGGPASAKSRAAGFPLALASLPSYTATYAVSSAVTGTMTWTVTHGRVTTAVAIHQAIGTEVEDDQIVLTSHGLRVVSVQEKVTSPSLRLTITANAKDGKIYEKANVNGKLEAVDYPYSSSSLVNVALLPTLAGVGVRPGQQQVVQDIILKHAVRVPIGLTAKARAKLTTPAGAFQVVQVTLAGAGPSQQAFFDTQHHLLVKYVNGQTTITLQKLGR